MEREKSNKGLLGVLVAIIILLLGAVIYLLFGKELLTDNDNNIANNNTSETPISEKTSFYNNDGKVAWYYYANNEEANIVIAFLSDGNLYYQFKHAEASDNNQSAFKYYLSSKADSIRDDIIKYNDLKNISKIRIRNAGTGVQPILFAITDDGKLYSSNLLIPKTTTLNISLYTDKYEIEDVLEWSEDGILKVLLKNGDTIQVNQK